MKEITCPDCLMPIMTPDMEAKLCRCDFMREELEKPKPLEIAKELHDEILRLVDQESNKDWALQASTRSI